MSHPVKIIDYDPHWSLLYEKEKRLIPDAIGHIVVRIEHIGSTAVSDLGAKPIIDAIVAVNHLNDAERHIIPLVSIGYEHIPEYEDEISERRYFHKDKPPKEQHYHLHMVEPTSDFWEQHPLFRDYLRIHPETAQEYYKLKERLATKYRSDREGYTDAKTAFVESIITKVRTERETCLRT